MTSSEPTPIDYGWHAECGRDGCGHFTNRHASKAPHACGVNTPTGTCKCPGFVLPKESR